MCLLLTLVSGCELLEPLHKYDRMQGIYGKVLFWDGNFGLSLHPKTKAWRGHGTILPVIRNVYACMEVNLSEVCQVAAGIPFYSNITPFVVDSTVSNSSGHFIFQLEPGTYSLFVKEDSLYYSSIFDGKGAIYPITVRDGQFEWVEFNITYRAIF